MPVKHARGALVTVMREGPVGVFTKSCVFNLSADFDTTADGADVFVTNCDNPTLPAVRRKIMRSYSASLGGGGALSTDAIESHLAWLKSGVSENVRLVFGVPAIDGGGYVQGKFNLMNFKIGATFGPQEELCTCEISLENDGDFTWTDAI